MNDNVNINVGVGVRASTELLGGTVPPPLPSAKERKSGEGVSTNSVLDHTNEAEYLYSLGIARAQEDELRQEELARVGDADSGFAHESSSSTIEGLAVKGYVEFGASSSHGGLSEEFAPDVGVSTAFARNLSPEEYPHFSSDDTSSERVDGLDVAKDALAFARVATSISIAPPLAVGVFGTWGAGKSFFMELVQKEIQRISDSQQVTAGDASSASQFHQGIVQIRFNAWHYAEVNLWASLVGHIFQELANATDTQVRDEVMGRLSTARTLTIEATEALVKASREHASAEDTLENAKLQYAEAQANDVSSGRLFIRVLKDVIRTAPTNADLQKAVADLKAAASELGVDEAVNKQNELTDTGLSLMRDGVEISQVLKFIVLNLGSWSRVSWVLALIVLVPILLVAGVGFLLDQVVWLSSTMKDSVTTFIAATGTLSAGLAVIARPVTACLNKLRSARVLVQNHVNGKKLEYEKAAAHHKAKVATASVEVQMAEQAFNASSARLANVREELHGQSSANRLINFIRARSADGDYAKHLGIISTIRKDFEQLSLLLSDTDTVGAQEDHVDLQRFNARVEKLINSAKYEDCAQPAKKKELLSQSEIAELRSLAQPIQLKAKPFSRIVLYIDDLDRCPPAKVVEVLQAVHMLLAFRLFVVFVAVDVRWVSSSLVHEYKGMLKDLSDDGYLTSASDYLEKIIQIPYWMPSMDKASCVRVFDSLMRGAPIPVNQQAKRDVVQVAEMTRSTEAFKAEVMIPVPTQLDVTDVELLRKFSVVIDSPRKMNRFVNVVLFLKARGIVKSGDKYKKENAMLFAQVVLATVAPRSYQFLLTMLRTARSKSVSALEIVRSREFEVLHPRASMVLDVLESENLLSWVWFSMSTEEAWSARLSFSSPDMHSVVNARQHPMLKTSLKVVHEELAKLLK